MVVINGISSKTFVKSYGINIFDEWNIGDDTKCPHSSSKIRIHNKLSESIYLNSNRTRLIIIPPNETRCTNMMNLFILYYTSGWNTTGTSGVCPVTKTRDGRIGELYRRNEDFTYSRATNPYELSNCGDEYYYTFFYDDQNEEYVICASPSVVSCSQAALI
jgi:hypothetical protein